MNYAKKRANQGDNAGRVERNKHGAPAARAHARKVNRAAIREENRRAVKESTTESATRMVVCFGHPEDARTYAAGLRASNVAATVDGRDVTVPLSTPRNNEVARNLAPTSARIFWE